jgi:hypothetical protein
MTGTSTVLAGIEIPSSDPAFLAIVAVHALFGFTSAITGIVAMLSPKRSGRHPWFGTIYYWCLMGVFVTASALAAVRWAEDYPLFILGTLAFAAAHLGTLGAQEALEQLGEAAYHRNGDVVHFGADCVLCGQRTELAAIERPASARVLGATRRARDTAYSSCPNVASVGADSAITFPAVSE